MDKYEQFRQHISAASEDFKKIDRGETVRLISHLDADGISSCAILIKLLNNCNMRYSVSIVQQLTRQVIEELSKESYSCFIFADIGSGSIKEIAKALKNKKVFILDHHTPKIAEVPGNIVFVNPHTFGIDGGKEISGAGVVYLFASYADKRVEELAHVAIIGAIGDVQEDGGFTKLNKEILDNAISQNKIKVIRGLRIFGAQTKPLHKVLEYSTDPYIPDVCYPKTISLR